MKEWPAARALAFFLAGSVMAGSVPDQRTRHLPEASQKARPNLMPGTAATRITFKGYKRHASKEEPQYIIKSDKTDHLAIHKGSALKKVKKTSR